MNDRKKELLVKIIEEFIDKSCPVGSKFLADKSGLNLSSATIRNEMAELEKKGYIFQPHTSAGRAPTEKGYQFYIDEYLDKKNITQSDKKAIDAIIKSNLKLREDSRSYLKNIAKEIAELSNEAILLGFSDSDFYYTGLSNIFSKPEFDQQHKVVGLSAIIDHLDQEMTKIYKKVSETDILIGSRNPFGQDCSLVITNLNTDSGEILGILGPIRMNYQKNYNFLNYLKQKLTEKN